MKFTIDGIVRRIFNVPPVGLDNESLRVEWIEKNLKKIPEGSLILDAGAGEQQFKKFCNHLKYVSQDFAQYDGKGDGKGIHTNTWNYSKLDIISDITKIPKPDKSFDAVMCTEVFEHLSEPVMAIKEFSRLIKKDGYLIITAPFCSLTHFAPYHYYTGYNSYFYKKLLSENGFEIIEINHTGNFFSFLAQEIRRIPVIANKYTSVHYSLFDKILSVLMLKLIAKFANNDRGSSELLCYDIQVFARKK